MGTRAKPRDAKDEFASLDAATAAAWIGDGRLTSEELVASCLDRITEVDDKVQAWAFLDRDHALKQARAADQARKEGKPCGPLHGVPVGIKDIFDTADMPTENGTVLNAGRKPHDDCAVVAQLRQAGAVIMGKTVTTELAVYSPGKTRNPLDATRTPGGSSSGSAAAVAAGMAPLAVGSQTNGSVIRPAAYCGVCGYKPSRGLVSRHGVLRLSRLLDHVGFIARTVADLALLAEPLMVFDARDPDMRPSAAPHLRATVSTDPPVTPRLAFVKTPAWDQAEAQTQAAFAELIEFLGGQIAEVELPPAFDHAIDMHRTIMEADLALSFASAHERAPDKLSPRLREMLDRGRRTLAIDYNRAVAGVPALEEQLDELLWSFDAIVTPATTGEAPKGLDSTGSPVFCTIWTLCGVPAVTAPLLKGEAGMPIGVQIVGKRGEDAKLLRTARWLAARMAAPKSKPPKAKAR